LNRPLIIVVCLSAGTASLGQPNPDGFVPGHIFVGATDAHKGCDFGKQRWMTEIDPITGESWLYASREDGIACDAVALTFTPEGRRLRLFISEEDQVFDASAGGTLTPWSRYGGGFDAPRSSAFDKHGNLFVLFVRIREVVVFPRGGEAPSVFADPDDGILGSTGEIAFAPNGDLFLAHGSRTILRFTTDGDVSVFDDFGVNHSVVRLKFDRAGNLYISLFGREEQHPTGIYRYDNAEVSTRRLLSPTLTSSILMAPNGRELYIFSRGSLLVLDAETGETIRTAFTFPENVGGGAIAAIFTPPRPGDLDGDLAVTLDDAAVFVDCIAGPNEQAPPEACTRHRFLRADLDFDRDVDLADFAAFLTQYRLAGDVDGDKRVTLDDFDLLAACLAGPDQINPPSGCPEQTFHAADAQRDVDVDLADFALLQRHLGTKGP
jgi:hypothetical protein